MTPSRVPALLSSLVAVALLACGGGAAPTRTDDGQVAPVDVPYGDADATADDDAVPVATDADAGGAPDVPATPDTVADPGKDTASTVAVPCDDDGDCPPPGLCVEAPDGGKYCATACDACPAGFTCRTVDGAGGPQDVCLPFDSLCRPCAIDDDCRPVHVATRDRCVPRSPIEGSFCARECLDDACPAGYACQQVARAGGTEALCMPKSGECACSAASVAGGFRTPCARTGSAGACAGWRECTESGLTTCSAAEPVDEVCANGEDEDCDGATDEDGCKGCRTYFLDADHDGWGDLGDTKCLSSPEGDWTAERSGDCDDGDATVHPDLKETCNGRDDDCNGQADDAAPTGCESYWLDADADGHGTGDPLCLCKAAGQFTATVDDDCDDGNAAVHPGTGETCGDGRDDDCDGKTDEAGAEGCTPFYADADQDGHGALLAEAACLCKAAGTTTATVADDCDDAVATTWPGATEVCANGRDDDCDGPTDEEDCQGCATYYKDGDGDGFGVTADSKCLGAPADGYTSVRDGDCADGDASVHPGATEACDGVDQDCDGTTDPAGSDGCTVRFDDPDGDGWGGAGSPGTCLCAATGTVTATKAGDCDETDPDVHPGAAETCNGVDDDCDGDPDPVGTTGCTAYYRDQDGDGFGTTDSKCLCAATGDWIATQSGDCDDGDPSANPDGVEKCGTDRDEDCDGATDEAGCQGCTTFYKDADGDGYGLASDSQCLGAPSGTYSATQTGDCGDGDASVHPGATEACNKKDDDCDGQTDEGSSCQARIGINADDGRTGGFETGACWCICEDDYNFKVADRFREWLDKDTSNAAGGGAWSVWMARKSVDDNPSLQSRIDYFNANDVDRIVTLSGNSYPNPGCGTSVAGTETWITAAAGATTKDLANRVQAAVVAALGTTNRGVKTDTNKSYAILDKTTASSVYLFYGFVTNYGDVDIITDPAKRDAAGLGLLQAIQGSFGLTKFTP